MEALLDQIIRATGWAILHSLWQGAIIYGLLYLVTQHVFRHKASIRYNLATFAGLILMSSFMFTFAEYFQWPRAGQDLSAFAYNKPLPGLLPAAVPLTALRYIELLFPWLVLLYSLGLIFQTILFVQGYRKIQKLKTALHQAVPQQWFVKLESLRADLAIGRKIRYYLSDQVQVPMVIGYLKPIILFPAMLATQLDMKQIEAIMIHELSHIKRNDYLFNLLRTVTETVLFFNPFVWLIGNMMAMEREHACDDQVVQLTQTPLTYAQALLQLEIMCQNQKPVLALAATGQEQHLYQRIKRITNMKTDQINAPQKLISLGLTFATLISLAWVNPANNEKGKPNSGAKVRMLNRHYQQNTAVKSDTIIYQVAENVYDVHNGTDTIPVPHNKHVKIAPVPPVPPAGKMPPMPPMPIIPPAPPMPGRLSMPIEVPVPPLPPMPPDSIAINQIIKLSNDLVSEVFKSKDGLRKNENEIKRIQLRIKQNGELLSRQFDSPEQKAKWEKYGQEVATAFNNPENKVKLNKYQKDIQAYYDSPAEKAKWKKYGEEMNAAFNSPEYRSKLNKYQKEVQEYYSAPMQKDIMERYKDKAKDARKESKEQKKESRESAEASRDNFKMFND